MNIARKELKSACTTTFGKDVATDQFVSLIVTKLESLNVRLGQLYWAGASGVGKTRTLQVCVNVYQGTSLSKRKIRLTQDFRVILDETGEPSSELGFGQEVSPQGDRNRARRDMGDYRN